MLLLLGSRLDCPLQRLAARQPPCCLQGKSKSGRIRQGSPQEEQQLAEHLLGLAPHSALCAEVGERRGKAADGRGACAACPASAAAGALANCP